MMDEWDYLKRDFAKTKKEIKEDWKDVKKDLQPVSRWFRGLFK